MHGVAIHSVRRVLQEELGCNLRPEPDHVYFLKYSGLSPVIATEFLPTYPGVTEIRMWPPMLTVYLWPFTALHASLALQLQRGEPVLSFALFAKRRVLLHVSTKDL